MNTMLVLISGEALVSSLIWLIIIGLIVYLLWWLIGYAALPEPFAKVARIIVALVAVVFLINFLLSLADKQFIRW